MRPEPPLQLDHSKMSSYCVLLRGSESTSETLLWYSTDCDLMIMQLFIINYCIRYVIL